MLFTCRNLSIDKLKIMLAIVLDCCDGLAAVVMLTHVFNGYDVAYDKLLNILGYVDTAGRVLG